MAETYPKISIITPSYNQAAFIEETILSVLDQQYPNLEYLVIDGGSTDGSVDIIKKYEKRLTYWVSEPDSGHYDALQKGFARTTGTIMGWLNQQPWSKYKYYAHEYEWIQQESTYWTRSLWSKSGGYISTKYKYAGDLELWNRFFNHEKLYTPSCLLGGFRMRTKDQLSLEGIDAYHAEAQMILNANRLSAEDTRRLAMIKKINGWLKQVNKSRILNSPYIISRLEKKKRHLYDFPQNIGFSRETQRFVL